MENEDDYMFVDEDYIREYLQSFLDHTNLADQAGSCTLSEDQWSEEIESFKKTFTREWNGEYKVDIDKLFIFINNIVLHLVTQICDELEKEGKVQLGWDSKQKDFVYMSVKEK